MAAESYQMPSASRVGEKTKKPASLPSGTVTFLFTDIEGSTLRWEADHVAMDRAIKRHDALIRRAIALHNGYAFKTVGDAFCASFARVSEALAAAMDAQRALGAEDFSIVGGLRVRMGLHTGESSERDGDYFGPAVNRVARLMHVGHGGQVLLSDATHALVRDDLPAGATLLDLGTHRFRDLAEREHVWQLSITGLPAEFPPLQSVDVTPNNLPIQVTSFRGREPDLEAVMSLLRQQKLVTLFGAGGVGKTRLALQVGVDMLDHFADGVWFGDFSVITDPELAANVVARVLGVTQVEGRTIDESIPRWLRRKKVLLVFDNCEHVLATVAALAGTIIRSCPDVRILATSRQALGISGEAVYRLPSLAAPETSTGLTASDALRHGAIALFVDRAQAADNRFALTDETAPVVAEICRRLDGIPLAIELAAARVKVLSLPNLAQRLDERFTILTGGSRTALPRQKTLSALIDWSYDLLSREEQTLFNRVGIFAGGFSLEAAAAVCGGDGIDAVDILDLLSSLCDKSLIIADTSGTRERYRLLESTRAYALEKLAVAGERDLLARRHGEYFRDEALASDVQYAAVSPTAALARAELELDNYRATLEWALTEGNDIALGGAVAGALHELWFDRGLTAEGRYWIGRAQTGLNESAHPRVAARLWHAIAALSDGQLAYDGAKRALALYQALDDQHGSGWALWHIGLGLFHMDRLDESSEAYARALVALRASGDRWGAAFCLACQVDIYRHRGDFVGGREVAAQALEGFKALGDEGGTALVLGNLAEVEFNDGHIEQALRLTGEALEIHTRGKNAIYLAIDYDNSAAYRMAMGDVDGARDAACQGLRWAREGQYALRVAIALQHFALLAALREHASDAARLIGYVNAQYEGIGSERESIEQWGFERLMAALREQLSEPEILALAGEGAAWSEDQAAEAALSTTQSPAAGPAQRS